jgi:hypothetical protein
MRKSLVSKRILGLPQGAKNPILENKNDDNNFERQPVFNFSNVSKILDRPFSFTAAASEPAASEPAAAAASSTSADPAVLVITDINASFAAPAPAEVYFDSRSKTYIKESPAKEMISAFANYFSKKEEDIKRFTEVNPPESRLPRYPIIISDSEFKDKIEAGYSWTLSRVGEQSINIVPVDKESYGEKEIGIPFIEYNPRLSSTERHHEFSSIDLTVFYNLIQYSVIWHKCWELIIMTCNEFVAVEDQYKKYYRAKAKGTLILIELDFRPKENHMHKREFSITNANYDEIKKGVFFYGVSMYTAEQELTRIYEGLFKDFDKMYHITADFYCDSVRTSCQTKIGRLSDILHKSKEENTSDVPTRTYYIQRLIKDGPICFPSFYDLFNTVSLYQARRKLSYSKKHDADSVIPFAHTNEQGILSKDFIRNVLPVSDKDGTIMFDPIKEANKKEEEIRKNYLFPMPPNFEEIDYKSRVGNLLKYGLPLTMFIGSKTKIVGGSKTKRRRKQRQRKQKSKRRRNI